MSKKIQANQKHLSQDNRIVIEKGVDACRSMSAIATELNKDPTTISKEVKKQGKTTFDNPTKNDVNL